MKCNACFNYLPGIDEPGCAEGGDTTNPDQDIYCGAVDGEEEEWAAKRDVK